MLSVKRYASWLRNTPFHPQWLMPQRTIAAEIKNCKRRVLDVGAADGWLSAQIDAAAQYIALDYPDTAIALYRTKPEVFADACRMPFANASIDAVACYEVMEHVRRPEAVLVEVERVLVPGGIAEFTMPYFYPIHDAPHDYQRWTRHGWSRSLAQAGLETASIEARGHSLHAVAVTVCLGLTGPLQRARPWTILLCLPALLVALPAINLSAWVLSRLLPSWDAMAIGYRVLARKPCQ